MLSSLFSKTQNPLSFHGLLRIPLLWNGNNKKGFTCVNVTQTSLTNIFIKQNKKTPSFQVRLIEFDCFVDI